MMKEGKEWAWRLAVVAALYLIFCGCWVPGVRCG